MNNYYLRTLVHRWLFERPTAYQKYSATAWCCNAMRRCAYGVGHRRRKAITVQFHNQNKTVRTGAAGNWEAVLAPEPAGAHTSYR